MKLKIFNADNCRRREVKKATLSINFSTGVFTIGKKTVEIMGLNSFDQVAIAFDEDDNEWYLFKTNQDGFVARVSNKADKHPPLIFNNSTLAYNIGRHIADLNPLGENGFMLIGREPIKSDGVEYFPIITASFKSKIYKRNG